VSSVTVVGPTNANVCGSVVTYFPDASLADRFSALVKLLPKWLIVDNASPEAARQQLRVLASGSVELIENPENLGVATALNQAARRALALGFDWLLTFDQDSEPASGLLDGLIDAYRSDEGHERIGILGSNFWVPGTGLPFFDCGGSKAKTLAQPTVITSGSLVSLRAFSQIGPFRDDLFIDGVDSEFCLRLRAHGFRVAATCEPLMRHSLGELRIHRVLWKQPRITHHSALRRYYMTRNAIVIAKEYGRREREWVGISIKVIVVGLLGAVLFETNKIRKVGATLLGMLDALRGRMGRAEWAWLRHD
jgi:rhamnosyltransferase